MNRLEIRQVEDNDLDDCYRVESACYTSDGATRENIQKRISLFPAGFLVAESKKQIIGLINSATTDKEDIADKELKDMIGHVKDGRNIVIFSLAILPEFQGNGISRQLMSRFIDVARNLKKENILLLCKSELIPYYQKFGFRYGGKSRSKHGGFEWHEMNLLLNTE